MVWTVRSVELVASSFFRATTCLKPLSVATRARTESFREVRAQTTAEWSVTSPAVRPLLKYLTPKAVAGTRAQASATSPNPATYHLPLPTNSILTAPGRAVG